MMHAFLAPQAHMLTGKNRMRYLREERNGLCAAVNEEVLF